ncbi:MAG: hypothetical protein ACP5LW_05810 [Nitrososphaeria archaeon]
MLTIADWLKGLGYKVTFIEQSDEPYVATVNINGIMATMTTKSDVRHQKFKINEINRYYFLKHLTPEDIRLMPLPASSVNGVLPLSDEFKDLAEDGIITAIEVFNDLPEELRMKSTHYINYPAVTIRAWKKMFTNSYFTRSITYRKYGFLPQVLYPPVYNVYNPDRTKDIDYIIFSRLQKEKMVLAEPFIRSHRKYKIVAVGMDQGYASELKKMGVKVYTDASFNVIKTLLERSKNYVHLMTFKDTVNGKEYTLGEHFGQSIVEALYAGAQPWVPAVPSGALEIPCVKAYSDPKKIGYEEGVDKECIKKATARYDPEYRKDEIKKILPYFQDY